jgi:hypothetical protein
MPNYHYAICFAQTIGDHASIQWFGKTAAGIREMLTKSWVKDDLESVAAVTAFLDRCASEHTFACFENVPKLNWLIIYLPQGV